MEFSGKIEGRTLGERANWKTTAFLKDFIINEKKNRILALVHSFLNAGYIYNHPCVML